MNFEKNPWDVNFFEKFKNFLKEKFGISIPEWHSIMFGVGIGTIAGFPTATALTVYLVSDNGLKGHLKDVRKEIVYFIFSFLSVEIIQNFLIPLY